MTSLNLPVVLVKGDIQRTAETASDYWDLKYKGFTVDEDAEENLSPQQKAARTRAANKAAEEQKTSHDGQNEPDGTGVPAGDANEQPES